jgi:hypothetical protein
MTLARLSTLAFALLTMTGCISAFPQAARPTASLKMHGTPPEATVTIDEEMVGLLSFVELRGVALPPGTHQVTVAASGYFPMDKLVTADPSVTKVIDLDVNLVRIPE